MDARAMGACEFDLLSRQSNIILRKPIAPEKYIDRSRII